MSQSHRRNCVVSPVHYYANKQADDVTRCALRFMGNTLERGDFGVFGGTSSFDHDP